MRKVIIDKFGGPEVLSIREVEQPQPGPDEVAIQHEAIGLNFIDTYHRSGLYPIDLPSGVGLEAAGKIIAAGQNVRTLKVGDRVCYCSGPIGAYADVHVVSADRAVKLPDSIPTDIAAASMLKGLTVQYLIRQIYKVKAGDTVLFHAAAGGVGLIACQWLKHLGATVIGTVSSEEKADQARKAGCTHIIRYDHEDVSARVKEITSGEMVPVVFDGVGKSTWLSSLDSLRKLGLMVSFGNASGPVTDVNLGVLASKGSLFVTRPTLFDYNDSYEKLAASAAELFSVISSGAVRIDINAEYSLSDIVKAHQDLEARLTTGSTVIKP